MENKELLQYLKDAIEVETDLATQEQMLEHGLADIEKRKPLLKLENVPSVTAEIPKKSPLLYVGYGLVVYVFIMLITLLINDESLIYVGVCFLGEILGIALILFSNKKFKEKQAEVNYQKIRITETKERNQNKQKDYDTAMQQCIQSGNVFRTAVQPNIDKTKTLLDKLYNKNIIYPKYCTLPALTSIYEYFMTGRCTELTGPHGAYNLYEDEVRKDTIINRLDTVIENLEQIRNNQYMLYQQVKSIKQNTDIMVSELQQIKGYSIAIAELTALNAYYAARTERNTRISMYYQL